MVGIIIQLIIALLIAGFVYMVWIKLKPIVGTVVAEPFLSIIDVLIWVLVAAVVLFMAIIPLLHSLAHISVHF